MSDGWPWPWLRARARRLRHAALPADIRARLDRLRAGGRLSPRREPLAAARFVVLDLETTGPRLDRDRLIALGAVAVCQGGVRHDDAFTAVLRQPVPSAVDNILVHRIGGQRQVGGADPVAALTDFLEYRGTSPAVAFRAEFDAAVLARELELQLGLRLPGAMLDVAVLLPALFPGTQNDSLDEWVRHFRLVPIGRHDALADAYTTAQLLLVVLAAAQRGGARSVGDLLALQRDQRWLGRRR